MSQATETLSEGSLQPFQNAAGHDGVLSDADGEIIVKPCTQAEVDFYQDTIVKHSDFAIYMPTFMGTLTLGSPTAPGNAGQLDYLVDTNTTLDLPKAQGKKIAAETAIVLENLEHGFTKPSVIDLKVGARLYAPGTAAEKAARLDKVAAETTTGSLNFRIAGMKVWDPTTESYDLYDKQYGRKFDKDTVSVGFKAYFDSLTSTSERRQTGRQIISDMLDELSDIRYALEDKESRFYSASVLIVFEGDPLALNERLVQKAEQESGQKLPALSDADEDEEEDASQGEDDVPSFRLKLIDFAHSTWCPGQGKDENTIIGLINIENQLRALLDGLPDD